MPWTWRGYVFGDEHVISGPEVVKQPLISKVPGIPAERWGPYKKTMIPPPIGFGDPIFQPPLDVDGIPILTQCRFIFDFMRGGVGKDMTLTAEGIMTFGSKPPACWDHTDNDPFGPNYDVYIRHPEFYTWAISREGTTGIIKHILTGDIPTQKKIRERVGSLTLLGIPLWGGSKKRIIRPMKKRLSLTRPTRKIARRAVRSYRSRMTRKRSPSLNLHRV